MSIATDLCRMSAAELAEAIRSGQVSSHEVVEAHLRRIEEVNPAVNAVPVVPGEQALEAARAANRAAARGGELPPLDGVPFTVKGNIDLADTPTTYGIKALVAAVGVRRVGCTASSAFILHELRTFPCSLPSNPACILSMHRAL